MSEVERNFETRKGLALYLKFDVTRESLKAFPELSEALKTEGAYKASVIVWLPPLEALPKIHGLACHSSASYIAVKAPTLEGTELWIGAADLQHHFESAGGFEKNSTPVLNFHAQKLKGLQVKNPLSGEPLSIHLDAGVSLDQGSGVVSLDEASEIWLSTEGSEPADILSELRDSGHLVQPTELEQKVFIRFT